jgi:hypothetical protein
VIADQSFNHVERFIIDAGHTAQRLDSDYGYDLVMFTYDEQGYLEPDSVFIQLKAAASLQAVGLTTSSTWTSGITTSGYWKGCRLS